MSKTTPSKTAKPAKPVSKQAKAPPSSRSKKPGGSVAKPMVKTVTIVPDGEV